MKDKGLYSVYNAPTPMHYAVDVKPGYAGLAVFERTPEGTTEGMGGIVSWEELEKHLVQIPEYGNKAGFVDFTYNECFVPDLPGAPYGGIYKGRSYIFADGMNGLDEIVDYSILDVTVGQMGRPMPWRNRFALSAREKVDYSFRFRAREGVSNALVVFMPFDVPFDQTRIEILCNIDPILLNGTTLAGRVDDDTIPKDGQWFKQWFFTAVADETALTVPAGGVLDIPFHLVWNSDGTPCDRATRFKVEADAGYLPKLRAATDTNGRGSIKVHALGLEAGDRIKVKLNAEHYSAVGSFSIEVV